MKILSVQLVKANSVVLGALFHLKFLDRISLDGKCFHNSVIFSTSSHSEFLPHRYFPKRRACTSRAEGFSVNLCVRRVRCAPHGCALFDLTITQNAQSMHWKKERPSYGGRVQGRLLGKVYRFFMSVISADKQIRSVFYIL